jgi:hypothetical protein
MPRISQEAQMIARYVGEIPKPEPPEELTQEQQRYWRQTLKDLAPGHIRSEREPCLTELCRQMSFAAHLANSLIPYGRWN